MEGLKYNEIVISIYASQILPVPPNVNGYLAVNKGDSLFWVNGFPLYPGDPTGTPPTSGESTGLLGNKGEIYVGDNQGMKIVLDTSAGTKPLLYIVWKFYIDC